MAPRTPRPPRRITAAYLERVSAHYLERYATTRAHLRRLLMRRVAKSCAHHGDDPTEKAELVDAELDRLVRSGFVDDRAFAFARAARLHRRGTSPRLIRSRLFEKGVPSDVIDEAVEALGADAQLDAARVFARKRRLGPWATGPQDRRKALAKLGRAGFSYDVAVRVLDGEEA